ncbi:MAG: hypothetical protein QHH15_02550 [Candidatus Thermoplasmatota archaeon]|jgi:hypothetical protein|nr:hypothetical protein [Candidatus Thermoplasmatota archaeon]
MKFVCNLCLGVFQAEEITVHYKKDSNGLNIIAICPSCLNKYMDKIKVDTQKNEEDAERMKMKMKW